LIMHRIEQYGSLRRHRARTRYESEITTLKQGGNN
jgi:hypothetical protein